MQNKKVLYLTQAAMIAALYVVLTHVANALGLASGAVQIRFSEALTILPFFTPAAIPGLFIGCLLSNLTTGCVIMDTIFGSIATLLGAFGTYGVGRLLKESTVSGAEPDTHAASAKGARKPSVLRGILKKCLLVLPPVAANTVVVPLVLKYAYGVPTPMWLNVLTVCAGELISCGILGILLLVVLEKRKVRLAP